MKFLRHSIMPENKANISAAKSTSSQSSYNYSLNFTQELDKANLEAKTFLESPFLQYLAQEQFKGQYTLYVLIFSYQAKVAPLFNKLSGFVTD